jgi:hypothetical protein
MSDLQNNYVFHAVFVCDSCVYLQKKKKMKKAELKKKAVVMKLGLKSKVIHKKVKKPVLKIKSLAKKIK